MPHPTSATGVRSFLGMINFCKQYIRDYSSITAPLRLLTKKCQRFFWGPEQQKAFDTLKDQLISAEVMAFYNPDAETRLIVDASPVGLGAILVQKQDDSGWRPISYGSHALDNVQQRYGQTEREALALTFFCQHFHHYLYDREFTVVTDHKPLLKIFASNSDPPPHIQRWMLRTQAYRFDLEYVPGSVMPSDYLSRQPLHVISADEIAEEFIHMIAMDAIPKSYTCNDIVKATKADETLQQIKGFLQTNRWNKSRQFQSFYQIRDQLSIKDDLILKGNLIVIPVALQEGVLKVAHYHHQGISKTKAMLREKVWWPSMNLDIENTVKACHACQVIATSSLKCQPLRMSEIPRHCWHTLAADIQGPYPTGEYILLLIDYRSRYPVATLLKDITTPKVIKSLHNVFTMFGYPKRVCTDNGPQFIADKFSSYLQRHAIEHRRVTPHWPSANGEVERMNRTIKRAVQCAHEEGKNWKEELQNFLLDYRTTPHSITGVAPGDRMFKHAARNDIPSMTVIAPRTRIDTEVNRRDTFRKHKIKVTADAKHNAQQAKFKVGDQVLCKNLKKRNKLSPVWESTPYTAIKVYPSSVKIQSPSGATYVRNKAHLKLYVSSKEEKEKQCIPKGKEPGSTFFLSSPMQCTFPLEPAVAYPEPPQIEPQNIAQPAVDVLVPAVVDPEPLQIELQDIVQQTVDVLGPVEEPLFPVSTVAYGLDSDPEELSDSEQTILYEQPQMLSQSQRPKRTIRKPARYRN